MEFLQMFFRQMTGMQLSDYLDIALTAFLIYKLLPIFKADSTRRIAAVILLVVVLAGLTELMHLYTVNFILSQFMTIGLLAVIVLFQPELRRVIDRLFSVRVRGFFGGIRQGTDAEAVIVQVVQACDVMSRERIGALIVFARDDSLEEYFRTGSQIDGMVSEQLVRNIFFPKASLHDGAMIIRDGRVAAAGCVLPLSESRLSADLGTRHRAGVGMSEVSDAVVVIVSEETGTISAAIGGVLKRHLTPSTLERLLNRELLPEENETADGLILKLRRLLDKGADHSEK